MNSQPLRDFVMEMVKRGYCDYDLDLANCLYVDSTFAGVIVALSLNVKDNLGGHVTVYGANPRCREQLHTLGVEHMFEFAPDDAQRPGDEGNAPMESLPWPYRSREAWEDTLLEAHQTLAKVDPANRARLQDVIDYMSQHKGQRH